MMSLLAVAFYDTPWFRALIYLVIALILARVVNRLLKRSDHSRTTLLGRDPDPADRTRYVMIRRLIVAAILFVGTAVALLQFSAVTAVAQTMLASAAIFAAVIGIAARAPLANLVSGVMIAFSQPVRLNDFVAVGDVCGTIERISLTYTFIRTSDGGRVVIPNEAFASQVVRNFSLGPPGSVVEVLFSVPRDCDVEVARRAALDVAEELSPEPDFAARVAVQDARGPEVVLRASAWARDPSDRQALAEELRAAILDRLRAGGLVPADGPDRSG